MAFYEKFIIESTNLQISSSSELDSLSIGEIIVHIDGTRYIKDNDGIWKKYIHNFQESGDYTTTTSNQVLNDGVALILNNNSLDLVKADGTADSVDLSTYLDNTNLVTSVNGQIGDVTINEYDDSDVLKDTDVLTAVSDTNKLVTQFDISASGGGDMLASVYDINNNGIVDNAEKVNGLTVETNVPPNAVFTDTIYDDSDVLKDADIGVTIQPYNQYIVIDDNYVSTEENYSTADKEKLAGIESGAEVNTVNSVNGQTGDVVINDYVSVNSGQALQDGVALTLLNNILTLLKANGSSDSIDLSGLLGSSTNLEIGTYGIFTSATLLYTLDNPNAYSTSALDYFGYSVGISGNYAIVGAYQEDDAGGASSGKAYIFDVTTGSLVHILDNPNAYSTSVNDYFGYSVSISGNYCVVGAHLESQNSGKAYIFNVTTGSLIHILDNPNSSGNFGKSVDISGDYVIINSYMASDSNLYSGKAYIFDVTTGSLVHTLDNPNAYSTSTSDNFGNSVSISGNYCVVGAPAEDDLNGSNSGKAYIFDVITGSLLYTLDNPNAYSTSTSDQFGISVAVSGNYCAVGAYTEDDNNGVQSGKVYIYDVNTGSLLYTLDNPNDYSTSTNDRFGNSVSISGNYAIIGAIFESDNNGDYSGKSYIFDVTTGLLVYTLDNPNSYGNSTDDFFGSSVSISGGYCIVGAYNESDINGSSSGKTYVYELS